MLSMKAEVLIMLTGRPMKLCHRHARAMIDLADGNGVPLQMLALEPEDQVPCWACAPEPQESGTVIVLDTR